MNIERVEYKLLARSSSGDPYDVDLVFVDGNVSINCTCQAGSHMQWCKHRAALINGDITMFLVEDHLFPEIHGQILQTRVPERFQQFQDDLAAVEVEQKKLDKMKRNLKTEFARRLGEGI